MTDAKQGTPEQALFWELAEALEHEDPRVHEGTIMSGRCLRVWPDARGRATQGEFLALVDYKGSGLVVKLTRDRVQALIAEGVGREFGPAGRVFREWVAVPVADRARWAALLREARDLAVATG